LAALLAVPDQNTATAVESARHVSDEILGVHDDLHDRSIR